MASKLGAMRRLWRKKKPKLFEYPNCFCSYDLKGKLRRSVAGRMEIIYLKVRANIKNIPHYLVDAKFEPGNYNQIQISPSLQATYSNLDRVHLGLKPKVVKKYFSRNYTTIRKFWVTEDGGRLYLKRNLHWIIQFEGKINTPGKTYRWMTLWELDKFIKMGKINAN